MPSPNRVYSEKEIAALLERTAQLQVEDASATPSDRQGLNLNELESIASEAGLDREMLHRAALEMEMSAGKQLGKNKTKTHIRVDRVIPSDLSDEEWEEIIFALRREFESDSGDLGGIDLGMGTLGRGKIEQIGRSREWRHSSLSGVSTSVLLRPHKNGTLMELSQRVGLLSTMAESVMYGSIITFFLAVMAGAIAKSILIGGLSVIGFMALLVPLIYLLDTRWREKKHSRLNEVADQLQDIIMSDVRKTIIDEQNSSRSTVANTISGTTGTEQESLLDEWDPEDAKSNRDAPPTGRKQQLR